MITRSSIPVPATIYAVGFIFATTNGSQAEETARLSHDFNGSQVLYAYSADYSSQGDLQRPSDNLTNGTQTDANLLPSTPYRCQWENPTQSDADNVRPTEIILSCLFSTEDHSWPKTVEDGLAAYFGNDRARVIVTWILNQGEYELTRFEVKISAKRKNYRSQNLAPDLPEILVEQYDMKFPRDSRENFEFGLRSKLPYRLNSTDPLGEPIVSIALSGVAAPKPVGAKF